MQLGMETWSRQIADVQTEQQNGEENRFKWLSMSRGYWWEAGWSEYFGNSWDSDAQSSRGFTQSGLKKRKYLGSGSCEDKNAMLMLRGQNRKNGFR